MFRLSFYLLNNNEYLGFFIEEAKNVLSYLIIYMIPIFLIMYIFFQLREQKKRFISDYSI